MMIKIRRAEDKDYAESWPIIHEAFSKGVPIHFPLIPLGRKVSVYGWNSLWQPMSH
jgi:hypothetical protein